MKLGGPRLYISKHNSNFRVAPQGDLVKPSKFTPSMSLSYTTCGVRHRGHGFSTESRILWMVAISSILSYAKNTKNKQTRANRKQKQKQKQKNKKNKETKRVTRPEGRYRSTPHSSALYPPSTNSITRRCQAATSRAPWPVELATSRLPSLTWAMVPA